MPGDFFECRVDSEENQGKRLCPLLVRVAYYGYPQCPVEAFHKYVSRGMVGGRPRELNATQPGQGLEKLRFELTFLVGGDGLWATEAEYPASQ
jgi:hypothetical protein